MLQDKERSVVPDGEKDREWKEGREGEVGERRRGKQRREGGDKESPYVGTNRKYREDWGGVCRKGG